MAFNLNKGGDEKKTFNLSKSESGPLASESINDKSGSSKKGKSRGALLLILLGLVILILGVWYFSSNNKNSAIVSPTSTISNSNESTENNNSEAVPPTNIADTINNTSSSSTQNSVASEVHKSEPTPEERKKIVAQELLSSINNQVPARFSSGSTTTLNVDENLVNNIIQAMNKNPNLALTVNGYASSDGDFDLNKSLSLRRAEIFKDYLVRKGIPKDKIITIGNGIDNPIATNETEEGRALNRRVEVIIK